MSTLIPDFLAFLDESPTPWHAVRAAAERLSAHGFDALDLGATPRQLLAGTRGYVRQGGTLIAFQIGMDPIAEAGFRIVSAHTDSPNLRIKPQPLVKGHGWVRLGVEVYGGVIHATWTDRDLGIAGQIFVRDADLGQRAVLVDVRRPICRIPNLAIHLNRQVNDEGLKLNAQTQLPAVLTLDTAATDPLRTLLAEQIGCPESDILTWDLALYDLTTPCTGGLHDEFIFSARLDNLASSHAAVQGLIDSLDSGVDGRPCGPTAIVALFDHEEIGSTTARGAMGRLLETTLSTLVRDTEPSAPGGLERALSQSWHLSADMAHSVHPAHAEKHEPNHMPMMNAGPVIKQNSQQRYGTEAETAAVILRIAADIGVPVQWFVNRTDLACGSTVGPLVASKLGVRTVDVGNPMLSMHSAREMCGTADHGKMVAIMEQFLRGRATT